MSPNATARIVAALAAGHPVTMREAHAAGVTRGAIRAAIAAGELTSIRRGIIAPASVDTEGTPDPYRTRIEAYVRMNPKAIACSYSAAHLLDLPVPSHAQAHRYVHILGPRARRRAGVWHHDFAGGSTMLTPCGIEVTHPIASAAHIALDHSVPSALIPLEAALRWAVLDLVDALNLPDDLAVAHIGAQRTARELLDQTCSDLTCRPGIANLRAACEIASALSESPAESYSHGMLVTFGYCVAQQVSVVDGDGVTRRLDFLIDGHIAGEVDGLMKYEGPDGRRRLAAEKTRDAALLAVGIPTARWTPAEMRDTPDIVRRRIDTVRQRFTHR